ncbi:MAG TPA: DUF1559 domain-containing protein [Abditibacteriaceae bacterium]|nr:DUF1559 domain-containing protein [Abditibacteriaceae bacterium]
MIEVVVILAATAVLAALLLPVLAQSTDERRAQEIAKRLQCESNLKQIALGIQQYIQDYDEKYPVVASSAPDPFGWAGAVQPYIRDTELLQCPGERNVGNANPWRTGYTDYWYNRHLAGRNGAQVVWVTSILLLGDGDGGCVASHARYALKSLPHAWLKTSGSPARRHSHGANYAFADGHVKWLMPERVTTKRPGASGSIFVGTFAVN